MVAEYKQSSRVVYNLCMMAVMVKEADLKRIRVPEDFEVLVDREV
jgi:hypothetical protein